MIVVSFNRQDERALLTEWFDTVSFDIASDGVPPLDAEQDDESDDDTLTAGFDPNQPRDSEGKWVDVPGVPSAAKALGGVDALSAAPRRYSYDPNTDEWTSPTGVSDTVAEALDSYAGPGYKKVNGELRHRRGDVSKLTKSARRTTEQLDQVLSDSPLKSDVRTYRGVKNGPAVFGDAWNQDMTGATWVEHGFVSTSANPEVGERFSNVPQNAAVLRLHVPAGTRAVALSDFDDDEAELLLARGVKLRVTADRKLPDGKRRLDVEVISGDGEGPTEGAGGAETGSETGDARAPGDGLPGQSGGTKIGERVAAPGVTPSGGRKLIPATIYKKHADGATVATSPDGGRRMRWDAGRKRFLVEERAGDSWKETQALTKTAAYEDAKRPEHWVEPGDGEPVAEPVDTGQTGTETELPVSSQTPEPPAAVAEPTVESTPATTVTGLTPGDHDIGYSGPSFEVPENAPQDAIDEFVAAAAAVHRGDAGTEVSARYYEAMNLLHAWPDLRTRLDQEAQIQDALDRFRVEHNLTGTPAQIRKEMRDKTRQAFAGKKIGIRTTPTDLARILADGRFKSQFESNKSKGLKDVDFRAGVEAAWFGILKDSDPTRRPIYGYVMVDGVRPAGIGTADPFQPSTDALSQYGQIQVVLRSDVRTRTTAMFGDSLNNRHQGLPSPVNQPDWKSFTPAWKSMVTQGLTEPDRDTDGFRFRSGNYAEAQVHGGVTLGDVEEVVFPTTPPAALRKQLDDAGVKWRVFNFKTAAGESPEERAVALRVARQDAEALTRRIAERREDLERYTEKGDEYTAGQIRGDLKKMETHLKRITDALPALEAAK